MSSKTGIRSSSRICVRSRGRPFRRVVEGIKCSPKVKRSSRKINWLIGEYSLADNAMSWFPSLTWEEVRNVKSGRFCRLAVCRIYGSKWVGRAPGGWKFGSRGDCPGWNRHWIIIIISNVIQVILSDITFGSTRKPDMTRICVGDVEVNDLGVLISSLRARCWFQCFLRRHTNVLQWGCIDKGMTIVALIPVLLSAQARGLQVTSST